MRTLLVAGVVAVAFALASCGEEGEGRGPADVVPAASIFYQETLVRPEGQRRAELESAAAAFLGESEIGERIVAELDAMSADDDSEISYEADIEPWLGERISFFATELTPEGSSESEGFLAPGEAGAIVAESTDEGAAREFVEKALAEEEGEPTEASHEGVDFALGPVGDAIGVVGDYVVVGTEQGFRDVVETEAGEAALADSEAYRAELELLAAEPEAILFVDSPAFVEAIAPELTAEETEGLELLFGDLVERPIAATVDVEADRVIVDTSSGRLPGPHGEGSELLGELPADAWFGAAISRVGERVGGFYAELSALELQEFGAAGLRRSLLRQTGFDPADVAAAIGDVAAFGRGSSVFQVGGGVVVESLRPRLTRRLVARLELEARRALGEAVTPLRSTRPDARGFAVVVPEAPERINVVAVGDRVVAAYGEDTTRDALEPASTLAESETFEAASSVLGDELEPNLYLDFGPLAGLLTLPALADPTVREIQPYVERFGHLVAGGRVEGERQLRRLVLTSRSGGDA